MGPYVIGVSCKKILNASFSCPYEHLPKCKYAGVSIFASFNMIFVRTLSIQTALEATVQDVFADEAANYETAASSGTTEYNGKSYDYEEFTVEGETVQYLFDGADLKIIKANVMGTESVVEIISLEKGADAKLFEIPEDYQMIAY